MIRFPSLVVTAAVLAGCGSKPQAHGADSPPAEVPGILHAPAELTPDFSVRQHVAASSRGKHGAFDAVLQKQGDKLVIVGLGPAGVRFFVATQIGSEVKFEQSFGPTLPFSPRNIVLDVHRAYFKRLEPAPQPGKHTARGTLDDEQVEEDWDGDRLLERRFRRSDGKTQGVLRIRYGAGCTRERCEPDYLTLENGWVDYTLSITCSDYTPL